MEPHIVERYDRQIRLWGFTGQSKCLNSRICLLNADSLGIEILKGLCLAGIGSFTILDSLKLTAEDVGCSFLPNSCPGKSRAESAKQILLDINEEVSGDVYPLEMYLPHNSQDSADCDNFDEFAQDMSFWKQFNCVIASGSLYTDQIVRLSRICWAINTPLIICKSIGFFGSMRSQLREHLVIDTHPENQWPDFHLDKPFDDLREYFNQIDLQDDSRLDKISSYPYIVIIYKYLSDWQIKNNLPVDRLPGNYNEKKDLRNMIDSAMKIICKKRMSQRAELPNTAFVDQEIPFENFMEASKGVNSCLTVSNKIPPSVQSIFEHPNTDIASTHNLSRFWLIIRAVKNFVSNNDGCLPVSGTIPDMTSSSEEYLRLQSIFAKKAREDVDNVFGILQTIINSSSGSPGSSLYEETKVICKNIRDLSLIQTPPIYEDYAPKSCIIKEGEEEDDDFLTIGLCLNALGVFFSTYGRYPGCQDDQVETDLSKLKDCLKQIVGKISSKLKTLDQCLYEICRYGGAELHATSAFMGGCIAQEVIKLVTNQYMPVNDTLVYNAIAASTKSFRFNNTFATS